MQGVTAPLASQPSGVLLEPEGTRRGLHPPTGSLLLTKKLGSLPHPSGESPRPCHLSLLGDPPRRASLGALPGGPSLQDPPFQTLPSCPGALPGWGWGVRESLWM